MSQKGSKVSTLNHADINVLGARVSTKESNAETGVNRSGEEHVAHVTLNMGFVEKVIDGKVEVPFSTSGIKHLRQALLTFIAWPTPLVKLVSNEDPAITPNEVPEVAQGVNGVAVDDLLREFIKSLVDIYDKHVQFVWDVREFGIPHVDSFLFLTYADVNEITTGDKCLNIAILQLWTIAVIAWAIDHCMDSLSLNQYTMQRIDVGNVKNILKNGLRNCTDKCT
ncbi:hypothetical protein glysoja_048832 [Glycine soja]|uniref:Uncharacterized protein n=1 Tax=Glycine soja TaxID=3848 RepID=A0A0B2P897_GLYSO|nr:hypothetical protein glysoja_048832 [Glycine soja]